MSDQPVRITLARHDLPPGLPMGTVEVRRITMPPNLAAGPHRHDGPVFGVIEQGSALVQVGDGPVLRLCVGETFYEPAHEVITKFDATEDGVTFLGWFPVRAGAQPQFDML